VRPPLRGASPGASTRANNQADVFGAQRLAALAQKISQLRSVHRDTSLIFPSRTAATVRHIYLRLPKVEYERIAPVTTVTGRRH
jgi:hypothetical protein